MSFRNSVQEVMTRGFKTVHVDKIRTNENNFYAQQNEEDQFVEQMEYLISKNGQDANILVYFDDSREDGKKYTLLAGERRYKAINNLYLSGESDGMIQVKIVDSPEDKEKEILKIIQNNAQRNKSKTIRLEEVRNLHKIWQSMTERGEQPSGKFVEWCGQHIGLSPRMVGYYLKKIRSENEENETADESSDSADENEVELQEYEMLLSDAFSGRKVKISKNSGFQ